MSKQQKEEVEMIETAFDIDSFDPELESPFIDLRKIGKEIPFEERLQQLVAWHRN